MNQETFNLHAKRMMDTATALLIVKGGEYAGSEDRLANFKRSAQLTGATPEQVCLIYLSKHYDAIATYVRDRADGTERPRSEPIDGRLQNLMNYAILLNALIAERTGKSAFGEMEPPGFKRAFREIEAETVAAAHKSAFAAGGAADSRTF